MIGADNQRCHALDMSLERVYTALIRCLEKLHGLHGFVLGIHSWQCIPEVVYCSSTFRKAYKDRCCNSHLFCTATVLAHCIRHQTSAIGPHRFMLEVRHKRKSSEAQAPSCGRALSLAGCAADCWQLCKLSMYNQPVTTESQ